MVKFYHNIAKSQSLNLFVLKNRKYSILYSNAFISVYFVFVLKSFYDNCIVFLESFLMHLLPCIVYVNIAEQTKFLNC